MHLTLLNSIIFNKGVIMKLFKREKYLKKIRGFYDADDIIKVITGVRRCGKSSLMQTIADELIERGIAKTNIIYIDLDKRGYRNITKADQLETLLDAINVNGLKYIFIDEIQNVNGFEEILNAFRSEGNYSFFITGSNSYLLSGELITKLTGRYLEFEMFPLSFDEYLDIKKFYGKTINSNLSQELTQFIMEGGFPRTIHIDNLNDKRTYVNGVIQEIFNKDIRKRIKIKDVATFEIVRNYVINNFGATTSLTSLQKSLNCNGISVSRLTLGKYIKALTDAKILYECPRFDIKSKRSLNGEKKYYLSDLSFYYILNTDNRINYGVNLENIVYTYAKSLDYAISVGKIGNLECDFILRNKDMEYIYLQVAYTIANEETENREYRSLEKIKDNYKKYLITTDYLLQKRKGILHVNLMDFCSNNKLF